MRSPDFPLTIGAQLPVTRIIRRNQDDIGTVSGPDRANRDRRKKRRCQGSQQQHDPAQEDTGFHPVCSTAADGAMGTGPVFPAACRTLFSPVRKSTATVPLSAPCVLPPVPDLDIEFSFSRPRGIG
ncbi:MAG: hypothetical protein JWM59_5038 [Verrucomicrobiales bacterium]|nr:hypothetical protein [Verrucomicrobiales bacterium]